MEALKNDLRVWCDTLETKNREMCALDADYKAAEQKFECNKKYLGIGKA